MTEPMTMTELYKTGVSRMRLPKWNQHAYVEIPDEGPWAKLFDVLAGIGGGEPIPVLIAECDLETGWEPASPPQVR